jgi:hypothetical protein
MYPETAAADAVSNHASLLTLNEGMLEQKVESNPWVQGAEVNENWKSGIVTVQVEERRPVLDAEVDGREIILSSDGQELPGLGGASLKKMELDRDQVGEILVFARTLHERLSSPVMLAHDGPGLWGKSCQSIPTLRSSTSDLPSGWSSVLRAASRRVRRSWRSRWSTG